MCYELDLRKPRNLGGEQAPEPTPPSHKLPASRPAPVGGQYTVFGEVVSGLEAVDAIVSSDRDPGDKPLEDQRIEDVTVEE